MTVRRKLGLKTDSKCALWLFFGLAVFWMPKYVSAEIQLNFRWDANQEPDIAGYRIFERLERERYDYDSPLWEGVQTTCSVFIDDVSSTHYFVVRAVDSSGFESENSNEIKYIYSESHFVEDAAPVQIPSEDAPPAAPGPPPVTEDPRPQESSDENESPLDADAPSMSDDNSHVEPIEDTNHAPARPVVTCPHQYAVLPDLTPDLEVAPFYDTDPGDAHSKTRWMIHRQADGVCVLDLTSDAQLTRLTVPMLVLEERIPYLLTVGFYDAAGKFSEWSEQAFFSVSSAQEDWSGASDTELPVVSAGAESPPARLSILDELGQELAYIYTGECEGALSIDNFEIQDPGGTQTSSSGLTDFFLGPMLLKLSLADAGDSFSAKIYFTHGMPDNTRWYVHDPSKGWEDHTDGMLADESGMSIILEVQDGSRFDADGATNGVVISAFGAGEAPTFQSSSLDGRSPSFEQIDSGRGGCFIDSSR